MEKETRERNEQDEALKTGFETKINEETQARTTNDNSLQESIESLEDLIRREI